MLYRVDETLLFGLSLCEGGILCEGNRFGAIWRMPGWIVSARSSLRLQQFYIRNYYKNPKGDRGFIRRLNDVPISFTE